MRTDTSYPVPGGAQRRSARPRDRAGRAAKRKWRTDHRNRAGRRDRHARRESLGTRHRRAGRRRLRASSCRTSALPRSTRRSSVALPSFNFPRPGLADGTDTIRPATLRGLAPDQTLVLVNGKRRHAASLVNVNGTIGRGSSAVDLNTIPTAIVQSIEVLRDGASAQYGSDAIAGVLNLRLREAQRRRRRRRSATAGAIRVTTRRPPRRTTPAGAHTWSAPPTLSARRFRRRDADGLGLERTAARRIRLRDRRRRVQGSGAHRARRLGLAAPVSAAAGQRVRSARGDVQSLQLLVRRAGARAEDPVRQRRLRLRERRAAVRLGELAGSRRAVRRASIAAPSTTAT